MNTPFPSMAEAEQATAAFWAEMNRQISPMCITLYELLSGYFKAPHDAAVDVFEGEGIRVSRMEWVMNNTTQRRLWLIQAKLKAHEREAA